MVMRTHMDYLFLVENECVIQSKCCTHFILPSEFWISIHNVTNCAILDKYENQRIWISLYNSHFLKMGGASSSEVLIYSTYNNHIQDRKFLLEERNMDEMITQEMDKSNNPLSSFFKPCLTLIWNLSLFLGESESCEKFRARNVRKRLSALDTIEMNFQPSTNKEISCVFFANVI